MTILEEFIQHLHDDYFFKEYTFSRTQFAPSGSTELELADNIIWLDNIFMILQLKQREANEWDTEAAVSAWFENKVLGKAATQVKNTIRYLTELKEIVILNDQDHPLNLRKAPADQAIKIIVYNDSLPTLPKEQRLKKFRLSKTVGYIHLFHAEDYLNICKWLITPAEIKEYLVFRELLYKKLNILDQLPEQYVLGHYIAGNLEDPFTPSYIETMHKMVDNRHEFDMSFLIAQFSKKMIFIDSVQKEDYYFVHRELALMMRNELKEFKMRFELTIECVKKDEFTHPYRIYSPRLGCGFVFIPIQMNVRANWKKALMNFTMAHKYDQKAQKCIGVVIYRDELDPAFFQVNWQFVNFTWEREEEWEHILKDNFPFRTVKEIKLDRYFLRED